MTQVENSLICSNEKHNIDKKITYLQVIKSKEEQPNFLMCSECILDQNIETSNLISYSQSLNCEDSTIIQNWPYNMDCDLIKKVKDLTSQDNKHIFRQKIENYFSNLENEIQSQIQEKKKSLLIEYDKFKLDSMSLIQVYNKVAEKNVLKDILSNQQNNKQELNKKLQTFFNEKISKQDENIQEILDWIGKYEEQQNKIIFDQAESIQNIVSSLINNIQFIFQNVEMEDEKQIDLDINKLDEATLVKFFTDFQIKNLEIKKKYLNYLQNFQTQTFKLKQQFNDLDTEMKKKYTYARIEQIERAEQMYQDQKKNVEILKLQNYDLDLIPVEIGDEVKKERVDETMKILQQLNKLKVDQIKDIEALSGKIAYLTNNKEQEYLGTKEVEESILPQTSYICNLVKSQQPYSQIYQEQIQQILKTYPIFELSQIKKYKPIEYKFEKSTYSQSASFTITKEKNSVSINSQNCCGTVYSDFVLENNKKYIVRFKFNLPLQQMTNLQFGLMKDNSLNTTVSSSGACLYQNTQTGLEQVKNHWLYSTNPPQYEQINEIEMRVCIDDNTLIFTDYPNYKTYNFKKSRNESSYKMDQAQKWRVGVYMDGAPGTVKVVTISSFVEVNEFPVF